MFRCSYMSMEELIAKADNEEQPGYETYQFQIGCNYFWGMNGASKNLAEAVKWLLKAASNGHAGAQFLLSGLYNADPSVPQEYTEAMKWYSRAAEQGDVDAQLRMCSCYASGFGVPRDYVEAVKLCRNAASLNNTDAQFFLRLYYITELIRWCMTAAKSDLCSPLRLFAECFPFLCALVVSAEDGLRKVLSALKTMEEQDNLEKGNK